MSRANPELRCSSNIVAAICRQVSGVLDSDEAVQGVSGGWLLRSGEVMGAFQNWGESA
jgi:hypothetical protein